MDTADAFRRLFGRSHRRAASKRIITDFDGVFNPLGYLEDQLPWPDMEHGAFVDDDGDRINVFTSPTVLSFFHDISAQADVDLFLLSTWCNHIDHDTFTSFGFPVIETLHGNSDGVWHDTKLDIMRKQPDTVDILWIEDELTSIELTTLQTFNASRQHPVQLLAPRTYLGLEPRHLDVITEFLNR